MDRQLSARETQRILVRCPNWVGDLVMATPALKAIRAGFPRSHIAWFVKPYLHRIIGSLPYYDEILEYDGGNQRRDSRGLLSWSIRLRRKRFDLAVLLPNSFSSALMVFLARIKGRVGYDREGRGCLLTHPIEPARDRSGIVPVPMVEYYLRITDILKCPRVTTAPELSVSEEARKKAEDVLHGAGVDPGRMTITMIPGAAYGSSKCWKPTYFAQVADHFIKTHRCNVLIVPGPSEVEIAREIEATMDHRPFCLADPVVSLDVLMAIIQSSSLVISNDTGPRHFAVALKKPVVVIMGPTDPRYTNLNLERTIVLREDLDCSPCHLKVCPRDHRCMTAITPDRVIRASETLLKQFQKPDSWAV